MPDIYSPDSYRASQIFGEMRGKSGDSGILYDSVRLKSGINAVAYRPSQVLAVTQAGHFEISVTRDAKRIDITRLALTSSTTAS